MGYTIKDIMSRKVKSVLLDANAGDALKLLIETGASGLPVIDGEGSLVGVFTEKEVLKAILPVYVKNVGSFVYGSESKSPLKKMAAIGNFLVKDIMRKEVPTLGEDDSLTEASRIMLIKSERRIIVLKDKKVVGIITRYDVVKALAQAAGLIT